MGIELYVDNIPTTTESALPNMGIIVAVKPSVDDYTFLILSDGLRIREKYMEFLGK